MHGDHGRALRTDMGRRDIIPFIGVYDVFSATVAARHFDALFASGFSLAASQYGLPDVGFVTWTEIVRFVQRVRAVLPSQHLLVDIDDGFGDENIAGHTPGGSPGTPGATPCTVLTCSCTSNAYWSSTSVAPGNYAWAWSFFNYTVQIPSGKGNVLPVRAVRGDR